MADIWPIHQALLHMWKSCTSLCPWNRAWPRDWLWPMKREPPAGSFKSQCVILSPPLAWTQTMQRERRAPSVWVPAEGQHEAEPPADTLGWRNKIPSVGKKETFGILSYWDLVLGRSTNQPVLTLRVWIQCTSYKYFHKEKLANTINTINKNFLKVRFKVIIKVQEAENILKVYSGEISYLKSKF